MTEDLKCIPTRLPHVIYPLGIDHRNISASGFWKNQWKAVLDDGERLLRKDMMCFAEKVHNRY